MKKTNFKVGDKVFAKVKGYPPWPAHVIAESGKKYNVEFYGTGETGIIKAEDLFYYLRNKDKFQKPLKRKDYLDAFEQIAQAIATDGGDGDSSDYTEDTSIENVSSNTSITSVGTPTKAVRKSIKRKRSISERTNDTENMKKKSPKLKQEKRDSIMEESPILPQSDEVPVEVQVSNEIEFVPIKECEGDELETNLLEETVNQKQQTGEKRKKPGSLKIEIVSEKFLKNNITYAAHVKENETVYKGKPVQTREDYETQILGVKLPSGIMGGIKLHTNWPLKFQDEYERAVYDESVAVRVLDAKKKIDAGQTSIINDQQLFIDNIGMSSDDVTEILYKKDIRAKKIRIDRLQIESELMGLDSNIKNCLGLDKANPKEAIDYLDSIYKLKLDGLMLIKHPHVVEMIRRLRKYVGNTKEWNLSDEALNEFFTQADKLRDKAEHVYIKFKGLVKVVENSGGFWEGFMDLVSQFRTECKDLTGGQVYLLCDEPTSRMTFLHNLEEIESQKVNIRIQRDMNKTVK